MPRLKPCLILAVVVVAIGLARPGGAIPAFDRVLPAASLAIHAPMAAGMPIYGDTVARGQDTGKGGLGNHSKLCLLACLAMICQAAVIAATEMDPLPVRAARPDPTVPRAGAQTHIAPRTGPPREPPSS